MPRKAGGIGSSVLCLKEGMVTSSPNILQNLWQEADIIRGFTGLVHFDFRPRLDISCLGADISVKFQELGIFAENLLGSLRVPIRLVKAMAFPVVMYGCESWTTKKAEC